MNPRLERANNLLCPKCGAALKSARGVRIGRNIQCLKCGADFTARPEDAEHATGVKMSRLGLVLGAALLYLSGGGVLAFYCFALKNPQHDIDQVQPHEQNGGEDRGDEPSAPPQPTQRPTVPVSAEQQRKIDNAIANGVWFLKDHILSTGTWGEDIEADHNWGRFKGVAVGLAALPALTLLECGVPADDPVVQKTTAFVRRDAIRSDLAISVYQRSLAILFLDRLGDKKDEELIRYLALCLMAGQHPTEGAWGYACPTLDRKEAPQLLKMLEDPEQSLESWHRAALEDSNFTVGTWDNSNTQFAVLALWVAQRHGVPIARTSQLVEKHFRRTQVPDGRADRQGKNVSLGGSWYYDHRPFNGSGWPTMTCSGLLGLAVGHGVSSLSTDKKAKPKEDPAIQRALAMLGREIDRPDRPEEGRPSDWYFLWSVARVGVLYNLPKIGGKDWYAWGSKELLAKQEEDGSWPGGTFWGSANILDTCFALLFLKQANLAQDLTDKLQLLEKK